MTYKKAGQGRRNRTKAINGLKPRFCLRCESKFNPKSRVQFLCNVCNCYITAANLGD